MKMYVGITDYDWFQTLEQPNCDEMNFWKLDGQTEGRDFIEWMPSKTV